jgi:DNA-binding NarL/FixJ family response regulator
VLGTSLGAPVLAGARGSREHRRLDHLHADHLHAEGGRTIERATGGQDGPREPLSPRELEVVRLLALGRTNAEIAEELFVALSTVKTHVSNVRTKLSARNRVEIAGWAWEHGLVRREPAVPPRAGVRRAASGWPHSP